MKKIKEKGFMLTETLIVTVFVGTILLFMFTKLQKINANYSKVYTYNTLTGVYNAGNVKNYLTNNYLEKLILNYRNTADPYIDITNCNLEYYASSSYCTELYQDLNIDKVLFLESDMYKNKWTSTSTSGLSQGMIDFIDYVNEDNEGDLYRLVVSYKDGTYASVRIKGGNI